MTYTRGQLPAHPAKGFAESRLRKISVGFPPDEFARIAALAQQSDVSLAEQVRWMCASSQYTIEFTDAAGHRGMLKMRNGMWFYNGALVKPT